MWSDVVADSGKLIIVSGPSGAGKSTVLRRLLAESPLPLQMSVSATTRAPRPGEVNGRDYHFVSHEEFRRLRSEGAFLECKEVFGRGDWYGTLARTVQLGIQDGRWVILEIDVQGALSVMEKHADIISFFIHPGSTEELRQRLLSRNTDDEQAVLRRLEVATEELQAVRHYRYEIVNRDVDLSVQEICKILEAHAIGAKHA